VDLVLPARALVAEGPLWDPGDGTLLWVDIDRGEVHRLAPETGVDRVAAACDRPVGAAVWRRSGGLAVALGLLPKKALLNDINPHLINFYTWLKNGLVIEEKLDHSEKGYYRARKRFNGLLAAGRHDTAEAAGLFYYLNRTGYNGLCRFNRSGGFNVPFGQHPEIKYRYEFSEYVDAFADWEFSKVHFSELRLKDDDFVYADPPYDVEFTKYSKDGFTWDDQLAAAEWLSKHKGPVILSNQATKRIKDEYKRLGFKLREFDAPRKISCTGDRRPAVEVLAIRNIPL
jgi:DNA adenine methylase